MTARSSTSTDRTLAVSTTSMSSSSLSLVASARSADSTATPITRATSIFSQNSPAGPCQSLDGLVVPKRPDYLEFLYPLPERPPRYSQVKCSRGVRFPVYERAETFELPPYSPATHHITLVIRKVEWLSPYEASPNRGWRNVIMEINSTQLNFYSIDNMPILSKVKKSKTKKHYEFTPVEQEYIIDTVIRNPQKYLSSVRLIDSYSLQHARFGIPIDYKKRNSCLRLRCETQQFLVQFISIEDLISWANYLSIGINVSLDLDIREMPSDRIVPRRRRNRRNRNRAFSDSELIRRELAEPRHPRRASFSGESGGLKTKISRMFGRRKSNVDPIEQFVEDFQKLNASQGTTQQEAPATRPRNHSMMSNEITTIHEEDEDDDAEEEEEEEEEVHSIDELHDDSDDESIHDFQNYSLNRSLDEKWNPEPKSYSRRKFLKDSLRCIKLLSNDDSWVGRKIVKTARPLGLLTVNQLDNTRAKNKFMEEYVVGLQTFIPSNLHASI